MCHPQALAQILSLQQGEGLSPVGVCPGQDQDRHSPPWLHRSTMEMVQSQAEALRGAGEGV